MSQHRSTVAAWLTVLVLGTLLIGGILVHGCRTSRPGPNLFTRIRSSKSETHPDLALKIKLMPLGVESVKVRSVCGEPTSSDADGGLEIWTYAETRQRTETRFFLGLLKTGESSQTTSHVHQLVFQDGKLIRKKPADPVSPEIACRVLRIEDRLMKSPFYGLLEKIQAGKTTRAELLTLLPPPTETFRKDGLEILGFVLSSDTRVSTPGEASASTSAETLRVSLADGIVVEAPYSTTADDSLRMRFEGWRGWSR